MGEPQEGAAHRVWRKKVMEVKTTKDVLFESKVRFYRHEDTNRFRVRNLAFNFIMTLNN